MPAGNDDDSLGKGKATGIPLNRGTAKEDHRS